MTMQTQLQSSDGAAHARTTVDQVPALVENLRAAFESDRTRSLEWRLQQLEGLERFITEHEREIIDALAADLGKPELEARMAETSFCLGDIKHVKKHLAGWMKPERVGTPVVVQPGRSRVYSDPLGVVLVIAPWNYPFQLCIAPLIGALAAGNCAVVKPSEVAERTSALIARYLPEYIDTECVKVVEGAVPETTALLEQRFDHIFYTGNGHVGRIVMAAAAKHLTPVTLELGGKSPTYVDRNVDLDVAAKRIVWGKFFNAGQTCVAPDYILAHEGVHDYLVNRLQRYVKEFFGDDPRKSPDYARIINERHHQRLSKLIDSGDLVVGGETDEAERYIAPTVLKNVPEDSPVMGEEIFGPILPVLKVQSEAKAIRFINARPKPLAMYVFTKDDDIAEKFLTRTSSGGATVNHVWLHLGVPGLPFGGVGESGMGAYHGRHSFDVFSHKKAVLKKPTAMDPTFMYPPYTESKQKWLKRLL